MYQNQANKSLTGEVRLSYVHLIEPYASSDQPNAERKYQVTLLIPKTDVTTKNDIDASIKAAVQTAVDKTWKGVRPPVINLPIYDGDGVRQSGTPFGPECKGMWVMTASRREQDGRPLLAEISNLRVDALPNDFYSGMYARCTVHFYGYNKAGRKGIGCALDGIVKMRDGESLGGAVKPTFESEFSALAEQTPQINPITGRPM